MDQRALAPCSFHSPLLDYPWQLITRTWQKSGVLEIAKPMQSRAREKTCATLGEITALSIARKAVAMSPAPAVREPHANRLSVSQPVDMHAQAIITAPMTNTRSEPNANLRSQGMVSSNSRSGSAALGTRLRRPTSANQLRRSLSSPPESCDPSCWCFSIRNGDAISPPAPRDGLFSFYSRSQPY
jgi:hypothetical protein